MAIDASKAKGKTIFIVPIFSALPYQQLLNGGVKAAAKAVGIIVKEQTNQGSPAQWAQGVEQAIAQKADLIALIGAPDPRLIQPQLKKAKAAGIPVVVGNLVNEGTPAFDNVTMLTLPRYFEAGALRRGRMGADARALATEYDVRPPDPTLRYSALSGGNQQKAMLAKWMQTKPRVLLLHEPTQGVDVGAREQIFGMIRDAAAGGMSVICCSSDYEQLAAICDRVLVVGLGRIVRELTGSEVTKERITEQCYHSVDLALELLRATEVHG